MGGDGAERIGFRRTSLVPGLEILDVENSARLWHVFNTSFAVAMPETAVVSVRYRGRNAVVTPGMVGCTVPGEVHTTDRIPRPGTFRVFTMEEMALADHVQERAPHLRGIEWRALAPRISSNLASRLAAVFRVVGSQESPLEVQSAVVEVVDQLVEELLENPRRGAVVLHPSRRAIERVKERLHEDGGWVDLATLARETGLSKFQVLRGFKQRYGMSPHAYQTAIRVARGQVLLRKGLPPSRVAQECGFADQSHFTRHFKRAWGVTPREFALAG